VVGNCSRIKFSMVVKLAGKFEKKRIPGRGERCESGGCGDDEDKWGSRRGGLYWTYV
jgi:hypothetical protein